MSIDILFKSEELGGKLGGSISPQVLCFREEYLSISGHI